MRDLGSLCGFGISLCTLAILTTPAWGGLVDYNTPGDLVGNFSLNHAGAGVRYSEVGVGGIGGSGSIAPSNAIDAVHTTALYDQESFDFSVAGSSVTVSQFVFRQNDASFPFEFSFQQLGILQSTGDRFGVDSGPDSYVSLRVMSDTIANTGVFLQTEVRGSADVSRHVDSPDGHSERSVALSKPLTPQATAQQKPRRSPLLSPRPASVTVRRGLLAQPSSFVLSVLTAQQQCLSEHGSRAGH